MLEQIPADARERWIGGAPHRRELAPRRQELVLGVLLLDSDARPRDSRAAQLDVRCAGGRDARGRGSHVVVRECGRAHRECQVLLVGCDVDESARDLRQYVELGRGALGVRERRARYRGVGT